MNRSQQSAVIQIFHWLWPWRLDCLMWSFPLIKTAKRWNLEKQSSDTKLQGRVTGRDRASFLGLGPVMHMPPEHCHSCTLHTEMVMRSNSSLCLPGCGFIIFTPSFGSHGRWTLPVHPRAREQSWNSPGAHKHAAEMTAWVFSTLVQSNFCWFFFFFSKGVCLFLFVCWFIVCGWTLCFYWLTPAFSRVQSRNLNSLSLVTSWSGQQLSLPCCFCMNYVWLASGGWCTSTLH